MRLECGKKAVTASAVSGYKYSSSLSLLNFAVYVVILGALSSIITSIIPAMTVVLRNYNHNMMEAQP